SSTLPGRFTRARLARVSRRSLARLVVQMMTEISMTVGESPPRRAEQAPRQRGDPAVTLSGGKAGFANCERNSSSIEKPDRTEVSHRNVACSTARHAPGAGQSRSLSLHRRVCLRHNHRPGALALFPVPDVL